MWEAAEILQNKKSGQRVPKNILLFLGQAAGERNVARLQGPATLCPHAFSGEETHFHSSHEGSYGFTTWLDADVVYALNLSSLKSLVVGLWKWKR